MDSQIIDLPNDLGKIELKKENVDIILKRKDGYTVLGEFKIYKTGSILHNHLPEYKYDIDKNFIKNFDKYDMRTSYSNNKEKIEVFINVKNILSFEYFELFGMEDYLIKFKTTELSVFREEYKQFEMKRKLKGF